MKNEKEIIILNDEELKKVTGGKECINIPNDADGVDVGTVITAYSTVEK